MKGRGRLLGEGNISYPVLVWYYFYFFGIGKEIGGGGGAGREGGGIGGVMFHQFAS